MSLKSYLAVVTLLGAGCIWHGTPIPLVGDARMLQGDWEGTYVNREGGRTGSILFQLKAGSDSAYGDIVMVPTQAEEVGPGRITPVPGSYRVQPRVLRISFVQCGGQEVTGVLDPYPDPETGERVYTTFVGQLKGDELEGTFTSAYPGGAHRLAGTWSVKRIKH
jgi:hypothetical protein